MKHMESGNVCPKTVTILTGAYIVAIMRAMPMAEQNAIWEREENLEPRMPPKIRPIIMQNQYAATTAPATAPPT